MAWAYLVGGEDDGRFFEHDQDALSVHPRWGRLLAGPGGWTYQGSGQQVLTARGRCAVYQALGRWVPYEDEDEDGSAS